MKTALAVCVALGAFVVGAGGCSSPQSEPPTSSATGGSNRASGGSGPTGGSSSAQGGTSSNTGGTSSSAGGSSSNTGGTSTTTGGSRTGGTSGNTGGTSGNTGGTASGGTATGGTRTTGGTGSGGKASGGTAAGGTATGGSATGGTSGTPFGFFVTSLAAMQQLSGNSNGFGGDLRFGEATGIAGADKICQTIAANEGFPDRTWRAFLSTTTEDAIDRIGTGPWYDRLGRLVATGVPGLTAANRPDGVTAVVNDLPNEKGVQEHTASSSYDDHDTLTGSNTEGRLYSNTLGSTCNDWTSSVAGTGRPMAGHHWPGGPSQNWIQGHTMSGCAPGVCTSQGSCSGCSGGVGCSGGYGAIYCFAL